METLVTVAVILALIAVGALVIHRLNVQHGNRISAERHSDFLTGRRPRHHVRGRGRPRHHRVTPPQDRRV